MGDRTRAGQNLRLQNMEVWQPMLDRCLEEEGDACLERTAELAAMFHSKLKKRDISDTLFTWVRQHGAHHGEVQFILGHHLDYNLKESSRAGDLYRKAHELSPNNPYIVREYLMWVDLEAQDNRTLESILRPRRFTHGS